MKGHRIVPIEEVTEEMADRGEYVNSEWLNDNAPIGQRRYREPAKAVFKEMSTAAPPYEITDEDVGRALNAFVNHNGTPLTEYAALEAMRAALTAFCKG